jgi:hypothetical protein
MFQIKLTPTSPLVLELHGSLESSDLPALSDSIHSASSALATCIVDFSHLSFSDALWPLLQRELIRWVTRASADLWYTGIRARPEWNHCSTRAEISTLLLSPELAFSHLAQWIDHRKSEIDAKIESLSQSSTNEGIHTLSPLYLEEKRKRIDAQLIEKFKKRSSTAEAPVTVPHSLTRLEEKILTALNTALSTAMSPGAHSS